MRNFNTVFVLLLSSLVSLWRVNATPAWPNGWTAFQPDNTSTFGTMLLIGTPSYHYAVVVHGDSHYVTIKDHSDDFIKYAKIDETTGRFVPTQFVVGQIAKEDLEAIPDLKTGLKESADVVRSKCMENDYCKWHLENNGNSGHSSIVPSGDMLNLVIPVRFSDHKHRSMGAHRISYDLFNDDDLSVKDFFKRNSHGKMTLKSHFTPEMQISKSEKECADNASGLTKKVHECWDEALKLANIDTSGYDTVTFLHSSYGAEFGDQDEDFTYFDDRIWSHSWEMSMDGQTRRYAAVSAFWGTANGHENRVGIAVHEIGQTLGAATMYGHGLGYGLGYYDVMASPWGFDGTAWHCASLSAYTKMHFGWITPEVLDTEGKKTIESAITSDTVYKITNGFPNPQVEYLLVENRESKDYDKGMRGTGLAIYHVDLTANDEAGYFNDNKWPANRYKVALIQADGRFDLERMEDEGDSGDLFRGQGVHSITDFGPIVDGELDESHSGHPNVQSYVDGKLSETGISIAEVSAAGAEMTFVLEFNSDDEESSR